MHLRIKVRPQAQENAIVGQMDDGTLKINVKAPAENGKANKAIIDILAKEYKVSSSAVKLITGHTSPIKLIRIDQ